VCNDMIRLRKSLTDQTTLLHVRYAPISGIYRQVNQVAFLKL